MFCNFAQPDQLGSMGCSVTVTVLWNGVIVRCNPGVVACMYIEVYP
jgi:hypothetical protein